MVRPEARRLVRWNRADGFRTRAACSGQGGLRSSDPGCYPNEAERSGVELVS